MVAAATNGVVDYSTFDWSRKAFLNERLRLSAFENDRLADMWRLKLHARLAARLEENGAEAVNKGVAYTVPWLVGDRDDTSAVTDTAMMWYTAFAPHKLQEVMDEIEAKYADRTKNHRCKNHS